MKPGTAAPVEGRENQNDLRAQVRKKYSLLLLILLFVPFLLETFLWSLKAEIRKNSLQQRERQGLYKQTQVWI